MYKLVMRCTCRRKNGFESGNKLSSGNPWYEAGVGITGERVLAIGNLSAALIAQW